MKKIKLLIMLLIAYSLVGCGTLGPIPETSEKEENVTSARDESQKVIDEKAHPIDENNKEDIIGVWYCSDVWRLYIIASDKTQEPSIGWGILYNESNAYNMVIDEQGRINDYTFELSLDDGTTLDAQIAFMKDGIEITDISTLGFEGNVFNRTGMYDNTFTPMGNTYSSQGDMLYVLDQLDTNEKSYMVLLDETTQANWIAFTDAPLGETYEHNYLLLENADFYPQSTFKGLPFCIIHNSYLVTQSQYNDLMASNNQNYDNSGSYTDSYDDDNYTTAYETPECDFPLEYDEAYYFPENDMWVVTYNKYEDSPIEISEIEFFEVENNIIKLKVKVKNNGEKPYGILAYARYYDKYGYYDDIFDDTDLMSSLYVPSDQVLPEEDISEEAMKDYGMRLGIPAGRDGYLMFFTDDGDYMTYKADVSEVDLEIRFVYITIEEYSRTEY